MPKATMSENYSVGGTSFSSNQTLTDEHAASQVLSCAKGQSGTLSTRTSTTAGTATLSSGHGITTGDTVDLYWTGGKRRGVTVGTVSGNDVPFSLGSGDNLPVQGSSITVSPITESSFEFDAEDLKFIVALLEAAGQMVLLDGSKAELYHASMVSGFAWKWNDNSGLTNPLVNDSSSDTSYAYVRASTSDTSVSKEFKIGLLRNSI